MSVFGKPRADIVTLKVSGAASSHTGSTATTTLVEIAVPPMGPNDQIEIEYVASAQAANANAKTVALRHNGTAVQTLALANLLNAQQRVRIYNKDSASAQGAFLLSGQYATSASTALYPGVIDTSVASSITITVALGVTTDTVTLNSVRAILYRGK